RSRTARWLKPTAWTPCRSTRCCTSAVSAAETPLDRAVRGYLDHLAVERGLAANTLASYRRDLRRYTDYLADEMVAAPGEITEKHVAGFLRSLRDGDGEHPPLSASSAARSVVAVRGLH